MSTRDTDLLEELRKIVADDSSRMEKLLQIAALIRNSGSYRWVGLYDDRQVVCVTTLPRSPRPRKRGALHGLLPICYRLLAIGYARSATRLSQIVGRSLGLGATRNRH